MHKTDTRWEAGEVPGPELIARVGTLVGEMAKAKVLLAGEGLRASSQGVRLRFSRGVRTVTPGPFVGDNELPAGFSLLRARSLGEAVEWASRQAAVLGDVEIDIRPVTEAWDIGLAARPADLTTTRYMALRKATADSEAGVALSAQQRAGMARLIDETQRTGTHLATENLRPSARGRRYKHSGNGVRVTDGPFTETKEMIAGYVLLSAESLDDAARWAVRYLPRSTCARSKRPRRRPREPPSLRTPTPIGDGSTNPWPGSTCSR
jgi:hypothetical protein